MQLIGKQYVENVKGQEVNMVSRCLVCWLRGDNDLSYKEEFGGGTNWGLLSVSSFSHVLSLRQLVRCAGKLIQGFLALGCSDSNSSSEVTSKEWISLNMWVHEITRKHCVVWDGKKNSTKPGEQPARDEWKKEVHRFTLESRNPRRQIEPGGSRNSGKQKEFQAFITISSNVCGRTGQNQSKLLTSLNSQIMVFQWDKPSH